MTTATATTATTLRLFVDALADLGIEWQPILRRCEIDPAALDDPEAMIRQDRFDRIWSTTAEIADDPCIGLRAGARVQPRAVNIFGYLLLSSATLGEGLRRVVRYQRALTGSPWLATEEDASLLRLRVGMEHDDEETRAIHAEYVAPLILGFLSWVGGVEVRPAEARFRHEARGDPEQYLRVLRCPVKFACDRNELVLASDLLELPSLHANARIARLNDEFAVRLLAEAELGSVIARTRQALGALLEGGDCDLAAVAKRLHLSGRTLQRRLAEEGTSFRSVVDALRRDLSSEHLRRRDTPTSEIAYLTGFSDVSAFTRAVRRWFHCPPSEVRRQSGREAR